MTSKAKLMVADKARTLRQLDVAISRLEATPVAIYREAVEKVFRRILRQTPQFSGAAVAHWTIGINSPSTFYDPSLGRSDLKLAQSFAGALQPLQRGDRYWIDVALRRELPKLARLRRRDKVFITNGVMGQGGEMYMEMFQDPGYAASKLRPENQPYELVYDSVAVVVGQYWGKSVDPFSVYVPSAGEA